MEDKINFQNSRKIHGDRRGKLPLDLPLPHRKYRSSRYRQGYYRSRYGEEDDKSISMIRNMVICAAIILIVVVLKSIDTPFTRNILGYVRDAVTYDFDIDEALGKLKFVDNLMPEVKEVFGEQATDQESVKETVEDLKHLGLEFSVPAEGKVIAFFGEKTGEGTLTSNTGIDIQGDKNGNIYAVEDGYVTTAGEDENRGKYLEINHGSNVITLYTGCSDLSVAVGEQVKKGEKIGKMRQTEGGRLMVHFETWINGKPVDPLPLLNSGN